MGWERISTWTDESPHYSDEALTAFVSLYASGAERLEDALVVEETQTLNQPEVRTAWIVTNYLHWYLEDEGSIQDEYEAEPASALFYSSPEAAITEAEKQSKYDWSKELGGWQND